MCPMLLKHSAVLQVHIHAPQLCQRAAEGWQKLLLGCVQPIDMQHIVVCLHVAQTVNALMYHTGFALASVFQRYGAFSGSA